MSVGGLFESIVGVFQNLISGILHAIGFVFNTIFEIFAAAFKTIYGVLEGVLRSLLSIFGGVAKGVEEVGEGAVKGTGHLLGEFPPFRDRAVRAVSVVGGIGRADILRRRTCTAYLARRCGFCRPDCISASDGPESRCRRSEEMSLTRIWTDKDIVPRIHHRDM